MAAEFTGERVIPGQVDADLLNEHLARYAFAARLASGKRVLDAGSGAGYGAAEIAKGARLVVGADTSADALAYAREHYRLPNLAFEQASVLMLPHPDASFDVMVAFEVIEHLRDWPRLLMEARRLVTPAGQFIVSTPNKLYYAESRRVVGPNPFHEHEFEAGEFRSELEQVFPYVTMFLENHVEGVAFHAEQAGETAEVRVDGGATAPADAHFLVAVCGHRPLAGRTAFVYIPSVANVLRERETHIALLTGEVGQKNEWLEKAGRELADLDRAHKNLMAELEERNRWAESLNQRIEQLQEELVAAQARAQEVVESYERKIAELEAENQSKADWGRQLSEEIAAKIAELTQAVECLHQAEQTVVERTRWAQSLDVEVEQLRAKVALFEASRWMRLGRSVGLGPDEQP
jgi:SAM-dependent methyltransferase